jgi:riboflavin kinase/FMN adenylyltransferase
VILPFNQALASQSPEDFIQDVLISGLGAKYVLVGDDFRFGAKRAGDYAMLDNAGQALGFDVARMNSYEVHGLRVSSTAVREALAAGDMQQAAKLLGHPYRISGHVVHGRKLGRKLAESQSGAEDGFRTLNLRFDHWKPAASGIFAVLVHGLTDNRCRAWPTWACAPRWTPTTSTAAGCCWRPTVSIGPPSWVEKVPTVKSSAWNFCTNCTTS